MGKESRLKMLEGKLDLAKEKIKEMIDKGRTIEDDEGIIRFITPTKIEITPKGNVDIKEFHIKCVKKMMDKKVYNRFNCYISEDNKKVIMEK